ncbi:MAG TPA: hypothetical protein PKJ41_15285 [Bryobacteraceae bacterium]|nr:hypothetical protein [Bryobacteraceae bacterium]HPT27058.1 hypothetical protein [Bryobacteraceae bacterium]
MKHLTLTAALFLASAACTQPPKPAEPAAPKTETGRLTARVYNSHFPKGHDTYNGMGAASDGRIYYVLSAEPYNVAGRMFRYDPATDEIKMLGDLTEVTGEKGMNVVAQGKSHVNFIEHDGKLYFSTHVGFYQIIDDMEKMGVPPAGWKPYRGGHLVEYDMKTEKFTDLGLAPKGEGVLTTNMDVKRGRIYNITWPRGTFFTYDLAKKEMKVLGDFFEKGENGKGAEYRTICRSIAIDPEDGSVYFTRGEGTILRYDYATEQVAKIDGDDLKKDYFGLYDVTSPGHMAYNWRQTVYHSATKRFYGVHGNSGYLFQFDPRAKRVEVLDRITSLPSKRSGMFDQFSYGYLGFTLGPDGETLYYLTGGPIYVDGKRVKGKDSTGKGESKGVEDLHLITWHIPTGRYTDHGAIYLPNGDRPAYVNSIAVGKDGTVYTLSRVTEDGVLRADLISIRP